MAVPGKTVGLRSEEMDDDAIVHLADLRRVSRRLTANQADAEDLVQDAYVRALTQASRFKPGTNLRAWLVTILRNLASNRRRDARRSRLRLESTTQDVVDTFNPVSPTPEDLMLLRGFEPRLRDALESLPKSLRDTIWLRDVEEMSYADIAHRLRIPIGTVMSRISRGRRLLHERLATQRNATPTGSPQGSS